MWISAIATILSVVLQLKSPNNEIEVKLVSRDLLTRPIEVDGLKSSYIYKGHDINKLWKLRYIITNIGNSSIIGIGDHSNLINNHLSIFLTKGYEVLESKVDSDNFVISNDNQKLTLKFLQWKTNEPVEILLYLSQLENSTAPEIHINEREIIDGKVSYTSLASKEKQKHYLYEYLPEYPVLFLKWFMIIAYGLIVLIIPFGLASTIWTSAKYNNWKKEFSNEINAFIQNQQNVPQDIKQWSSKHWEVSGIPQPKIPKERVRDTVLGFIIIFIFVSVPLLFMVSL